MPRGDERPAAPAHARRRPPPLVWLGAAILVASLAGSLLTIVLAIRHADVEVAPRGAGVLAVPLERVPATPATERGPAAPR